MPDWLVTLLFGAGTGLIGYLFRGWIDDRFARAKEARAHKTTDLRALREDLLVLLGPLRAEFDWLLANGDIGMHPTAAERAQRISDWVYTNSPRYPRDKREPMYIINNVAHANSHGDRKFMDLPDGHAIIEGAWDKLETYADELTKQLHSPD